MTALATMAPSFAMLLARHSSVAEGAWPRAAQLGVAPLLCHCASCGVILRDQAGRLEQGASDESRADQIFTHLGIASFSTLLPLALLFIKPGHVSQTLRQFAPLVSVFGIPAIATGVALLQWPAESQSGKTRTAATSVGLVGSMILLAARRRTLFSPTPEINGNATRITIRTTGAARIMGVSRWSGNSASAANNE